MAEQNRGLEKDSVALREPAESADALQQQVAEQADEPDFDKPEQKCFNSRTELCDEKNGRLEREPDVDDSYTGC